MATLLDLLAANQNGWQGAPTQAGLPSQNGGNDVSSLSSRVQELLGAKDPVNTGIAGNALSGRFDTGYGDYSQGIIDSALGKPTLGPQVAQQRLSSLADVGQKLGMMQYYSSIAGTGKGEANIAAQRIMAENPGMSFTDAFLLASAKQGQGITYDPKTGAMITRNGAPQAAGLMAQGKQSGTEAAEVAAAGPKERNKELGKQTAENQQQAVGMSDITGLYDKLISDAKVAPSGAIESGIASAANKLNMPTKGSIAQGTFDADLNNLYLGTIRTLKGTGRVMEQELNQIAQAAPKPSDSTEVKIAKAQAHMAYYQNRMRELGFDPSSGQSVNDGSSTPQLPLAKGGPVNLSGGSQSGGNDTPAGATLVGTSNGKAVYQLPDGSHVMEQ